MQSSMKYNQYGWIDVENCYNNHHHNCVIYTETDVEKLHVYETIISFEHKI